MQKQNRSEILVFFDAISAIFPKMQRDEEQNLLNKEEQQAFQKMIPEAGIED